MKKTAIILTTMLLCAAIGACAAPATETAVTPAPVVDVIATPAPTVEPTPEPTPEPVPCAGIQAEIEAFLPDSAFRDMTEEELAPWLEKLNNDFEGWGRTDDAGNAYILINTQDSWDQSIEYSVSQVSREDDTWFEVNVLPEGASEYTESYEVHDVAALELYPDEGYGHMITEAENSVLYNAVRSVWRTKAGIAAEMGLTADNPWDKPHIAVTAYNEQIRDEMGYSMPTQFYLVLTEEQADEARALIEAGEKIDGKKANKNGDVYNTGVYIHMDDTYYPIFSEGYYAVGYGYNSNRYNPALCEWVENLLGRDIDAWSPDWFDGELASATLEWPGDVIRAEGWQTQTVTDADKLAKLMEMFRSGNMNEDGKCPTIAPLTLTRTDGETLTIWIATDNCATAVINGTTYCNYGEQAELAEIFDEIMTVE